MSEGNYRKLIVWQKSMELVDLIYALTSKFPEYEQRGLADQLRRAAVSVPSNIAEGKYRFSLRERQHFFRIAYGSCGELDTQITIAHRLKYLKDQDYQTIQELCDQLLRMLNSLLKCIAKG